MTRDPYNTFWLDVAILSIIGFLCVATVSGGTILLTGLGGAWHLSAIDLVSFGVSGLLSFALSSFLVSVGTR